MNKAELVELWNNFIAGFCNVEFLCHGGEPNWLGWIVIGWAGLMGAVICTVLFFSIALSFAQGLEKGFRSVAKAFLSLAKAFLSLAKGVAKAFQPRGPD